MLSKKIFICKECKKEFMDKEECIKHENEHKKCICKKENKYIIHAQIERYDIDYTLVTYLNFKKKILVKKERVYEFGLSGPWESVSKKGEEIKIKYCPFCGEKL